MFIIARKLGVNLPRNFKYLSMDLREKEIYILRRGIFSRFCTASFKIIENSEDFNIRLRKPHFPTIICHF